MSVNLLEELGLDPRELRWQDLALCNGLDTEIFFEYYENSEQAALQADQICLHCPVMKQCGMAGMNNEAGTWGAIYWNGSGKPDQLKNSHKSQETWKEIWSKLNE